MEMQDVNWQELISLLKDQHREIQKEEQTALKLLKENDQEGYKAHLENKAKLVANLYNAAKSQIEKLDPQVQNKVKNTLRPFSQSAAFGLKIASVFYWSSLLYRDDHKPDEPDNLQALISKMETLGPNY